MKYIISLIIVAGLAGATGAQNDSVRTIRSIPTNSPVIDGVLEAEWWQVRAEGGFVQRDPDEGQPCTQLTDLRVMHSPWALYVALRCHEQDAGRIRSELTKRDRIDNSDQVMVYLDTYHDHRTAFYFVTNPHGVQSEGVIYNDDWSDDSWDGHWEVATTRDDSGWTAEMKIPLNTLRFPNAGEEQTWGFNVQRYRIRDRESAFWQPVTRDRGRRVSGFGHLEGLSGLTPGRGLELRPYAVANFTEEGEAPLRGYNDWENLGVDAKYRLSSTLTLDATLNPDFAQIEADDEIINLSDYPVYLTEKRPFFLEGASIFDTPWDFFYSRRITNPQAGGKISGKIGGTRLMAVAARNENGEAQIEDFGILRLKRDVLGQSNVGVTVTDKEGPGGYYARLWAADARVKFNDRWAFSTLAGQSYRPGIDQDNWTYRAETSYSSDRYSGNVYFSAMTRDFDMNDAGFMSYSDYRRTGFWWQYAPRPMKWGVRKIHNNFNGTLEWQHDFSHRERYFNYNNSFEFMNHWWAGFGAEYNEGYRRDYVDEGESYQNYDNFGQYNYEFHQGGWQWIWAETDFSRPLAFGTEYAQGDYWDGYSRRLNATLQVRPRENLEIRLRERFTHVFGVSDIEEGAPTDFIVGQLKVEWTASRKIYTRLNTQYVHRDKVYLTNALIGYNFAPESWAYLVYDDSRHDQPLGWNSVQDRIIKMKVTYFVQI